ncbi:MAG: sugar phosphate isomerase [Candidatus Poribacteria bacterium]|nr:MAG: sugar phosphate isomerase [Candidatus Poribacteria bacterium]
MYRNLSPGAVGIPTRSLEEGLHYAQIGEFEGLDLPLGQVREIVQTEGPEGVRQRYAEAGIQIGGWGLPVNWRGSDAEFYASLAQLPEQARLAAEIGSFRTMTWVVGWSNERTRKEQFDFLVKRFRLIAEILRDYGIALGLEFIGPHTSRKNARYGCVYTMDAMLAICCAIDTGNVGLLLDSWHWYCCQSTVTDLRQLVAEEVVYVHINDAPAGVHVLDQVDNVRCLPGETGVIDLNGFLGALKEIGYDGPVTPEPFSRKLNEMDDKEEAARLVGGALKSVWKAAGLME